MDIERNPQVRRIVGLGDAVAAVAKPVARAIGKDPNCLPCARRQAALNAVSDRIGERARAFGRRIFRRKA